MDEEFKAKPIVIATIILLLAIVVPATYMAITLGK